MTEPVIIKSHKNGIRLILSNEIPFDQLLSQIEERFRVGKTFFGDALMVLQIEGRLLSDSEERLVVETIQSVSNVRILCIVGYDEESEKNYVSILETLEEKLKDHDIFKLYRGSLINGASFCTEEALIILGDVNPGCTVEAGGSIVILGGLYGTAIAGKLQPNSFIIALELSPTQMNISGIEYRPSEKPKWGIKPKINPKCAYVAHNKVEIDNLSKSVLENLYGI